MNGKQGGLGTGDMLGEFRILSQLGVGGMGVVYLARDERLDRRVALKVIAPHLSADEGFRERFIAEARSAAAIENPHAVPVYVAGVEKDTLYIAMRYVSGTDLRHFLAQEGPIPRDSAAKVITEIAEALDAAHAAGMVHRDVKPANILLEGAPGEGKSYLTDFGLSKGRDDSEPGLTGTGQWVGTIDYVAPEQIQGERIDARTDVYALGCVLYECLAGKTPFSGNDAKKMVAHLQEPFPRLGGAEAGPMADVVARATAKDPADRFPSAGDLARAASAAATGIEVEVPERSVATGSAAAGLVEAGGQPRAPSRQTAPTVTGAAPRGFRDRATTTMSSPGEGNGKGNGPHTAAIIGASAVIAAGLIAAAVVIAGGSSEPNVATSENRQKQHTKGVDKQQTTPSANLPDDLVPCAPSVYVKERRPGQPYTSCAFAMEVSRAYFSSGESSQISAYSPTTEKAYSLRCTGSNPVICRGGTNAAVYITPPSTQTSSVPIEKEPEATVVAESSPEPNGELGDWPGGSAYSAMLGAFPNEANARTRQAKAVERGLDAGVLYSSNFSSLRPDYWVVFSGSFSTASEATARAERAHSLGFMDAYPRFVSP